MKKETSTATQISPEEIKRVKLLGCRFQPN